MPNVTWVPSLGTYITIHGEHIPLRDAYDRGLVHLVYDKNTGPDDGAVGYIAITGGTDQYDYPVSVNPG